MKIRMRAFAAASVMALAAHAVAAPSPLRVGFFKGVGANRYWNINMHQAGDALATLLAAPDAAGLGPALVKPAAGIVLTTYGVPESPTDTLHQLRYPSAEQKAAFLSALDSLDVVIFSNSTGLDGIFPDAAQRQRLERFIKTRGVVGLHWTWQTGGSGPTWGTWDSLPGARSGGWIVENMGTLRRDTTAQDPASRFLNKGLPDSARFREKWLSFTLPPGVLRAIPGLKVTMTLDSASLGTSAVAARDMRAHEPYSWHRELPEGGRFFYTGLGHRVELFTGAAIVHSVTGDTVAPPNNYLRRQLYNAILWAAGADSNGVVPVRGRADQHATTFLDAARLAWHGGALSVSVLHQGAHHVELRGVEGRRVAVRRGSGTVDHSFAGLRPGVHIVSVTTPQGLSTRRIAIP